jgi:hypothetical protein
MQFPVLMGGKIFTGQRGTVPGVTYHDDFWTRRCREAWEQYQADPSRLHTYSSWDAVPGNPTARSVHQRRLDQYRTLVEEGTWAWLEIADSDLFLEPLPAGIVASAFANTDVYLVLANYTRQPATVATRHSYVPLDRPAEPSSTAWTLAGRSLKILRLSR